MQQNIILKWALILSAVIVSNLFFHYSLSLIFDGPKNEDFCPFEKTSQVVETKEACELNDGIWNPGQSIAKGSEIQPIGYCDLYSKCNNAYEVVKEEYEKKVFIALISIGVIILIASVIIKNNSAVVSALAITAFVDLVVASIRYWQYSDELLKVSLLFIALVVIFYLIIKKFRDHERIQS